MEKDDKKIDGINCIKMSIYFFTKEGGVQLPDKQIFPKGKVTMPTNHRHGIRISRDKEVFFGGGNQPNLYEAIRKCLDNYEITIIPKDKIPQYKKLIKVTKEIKKTKVNL